MTERTQPAGLDLFPEAVEGVRVPYDAPVAELAARLRRPGPGARAAFLALAADPSAEAFELLRSSCAVRDAELRRAALAALGRHHEAPRAAELVTALLDDEDEQVARTALAVGAELELPAARARAFAWLAGADEGRRHAAVAALGALLRDEDFERALASYLAELCLSVRRELAVLLAAFAPARHAATMFALLVDDPDPRTRAAACALAERTFDLQQLERVRALRVDPNADARAAAESAVRTLEERALRRTLRSDPRLWRSAQVRVVLFGIGVEVLARRIEGVDWMERALLMCISLLVGAITIWHRSAFREWLELSGDGIEGPGRHGGRVLIPRARIDAVRTLERGLRPSLWRRQRIHATSGPSIHFARGAYTEAEIGVLVAALEALVAAPASAASRGPA